MDHDAVTPKDPKRRLPEEGDAGPVSTPASSAKRRKLGAAEGGSPSTPRALDAISSVISSVFGSRLPQQPRPVPTADAPSPQGVNAGSPPRAAPAPAHPPPKRPAIKLAALRGTKWDTEGSGPPRLTRSPARSPKKATPHESFPRPSKARTRAAKDHSAGAARPGGTQPDGPAPDAGDQSADELTAADPTADWPKKTPDPGQRPAARSAGGPRGILTPRKRRGRPPKNVTFTQELGGEPSSKHLPKAARAGEAQSSRIGKKNEEEDDEIRCAVCSRPDSQPPNEIILCDNCDFSAHQECYGVPEIPEGDWLCRSCAQEDALEGPQRPPEACRDAEPAATAEVVGIANLDEHLRALQRVLLDRCCGRRRFRMYGQEESYEKAKQLVEQTVVAGEGNSMLVLGPRGCGKTAMIESIIRHLSREHRHLFHVVRLSGHIHTDDKLALKEIWRQLGKEMEVEDDVVNRASYADTMASLLALLSHPSEIMGADEGVTSQSVVFVIDELDMFACHARQTLLYNLFDIAQSRKAPIAVLGCTSRLDVVEMLEKRVKSRFSHRYVYLSAPKSLHAFWQLCKQGLMIDRADVEHEGIDASLEGYDEFHRYWTDKIGALYKQQCFQELLRYHYLTTKSASAFLSEWILPLASLSASDAALHCPAVGDEATSLAPPGSRLQLLSALSELDLGMLIAAARLDVVALTDTVNFAMAYDEYSSLVGRQRVQSSTASMLAVGGSARGWSRGVAAMAWERLVSLGMLVPAGVGVRTPGHGGLEGKMWKVDVALEEIPAAVKLNAVLARWCREI